LKPGVKLWSEALATSGYRMLWSGKWHVSIDSRPKDHGWEERFLSGHYDGEHALLGIDPGWDLYRTVAEKGDSTQREEGMLLRPGYGARRMYGVREDNRGPDHDERTVETGLEAIEELAGSEAPWALHIGLISPHDPYMAPRTFLDQYDPSSIPLPPSFRDSLEDKPRIYRRMRRQIFDQLSEREAREAIRHFWAFCSYLDYQFGRVLQMLERTGQSENTIVIYLSDHGDYLGDHGLFCKGIPAFRGAYHVPLLVRWPAGIRNSGRDVDAFVSLADVGPTLLDLAQAPSHQRFTGRSLAPFLQDVAPAGWRDEMHGQCNGVELYFTQRSVFTREFKYVFNGFDDDELYDLRADPHELVNLAAQPEHTRMKHDLVRRMWRFAHQEEDTIINGYTTVALAPWGPAEAFK
jgi:arylsulfatase A-like enzyme